MSEAWAYAQTTGLVVHNHITLLGESLINYANGAGSCPISAVDTLTRVALEAYAVPGWIVDPTIDTWERYKRWICLETINVRLTWGMLHESDEHAKNPALIQLYEDADRNQLRLVCELNQFLRGWRQYCRYGNSTRSFAKLDRYVDERMALLLSKRHGRRGRAHGLKLIIGSGNRLGLEQLAGTIMFKRTAHATQ